VIQESEIAAVNSKNIREQASHPDRKRSQQQEQNVFHRYDISISVFCLRVSKSPPVQHRRQAMRLAPIFIIAQQPRRREWRTLLWRVGGNQVLEALVFASHGG
jgi:hypothetical protein